MMVKKLPSLLEMAGFSFFVPQFALGVFFEYRDYIHWAEKTAHYKKIPSPVLPSLRLLLEGLVSMILFLIGDANYPVSYCYTDEFGEWSLAYKLFYAHVAWQFKRLFYYMAFRFSQGAMVAIGFGYNGEEEEKESKVVKHNWDRIVGVYIFECEVASNANSFLKSWNNRVHVWIKHYLSERLTGENGRPSTIQYITIYFISAFWHGFYPFYYVTFGCIFLSSFAHKDLYQCWFILRSIPLWLRNGVSIIVTQQHINYIGVLVTALTMSNGMKFLRSTYFCVPIFLVA